MSAKRQATSDLNHDNWDREEEEEHRGTFRNASEDELKNRVIKKARRKVAAGISDSADGSGGAGAATSKGVFSGFAGFGKAAAAPAAVKDAAASPFSFLSKIPAVAACAVPAPEPTFSFGSSVTAAGSAKPKEGESAAEGGQKATTTTAAAGGGGEKSANYYAKLKALNQAVSEWIKTHVDKNPICLLTPIFKDYENHLVEIEREEAQQKRVAGSDGGKKLTTSNAPTGISSFKFSASSSTTSAANTTAAAAASTFSFSASPALSSTSAAAATNAKSIFGGASTAQSKPSATAEPPKTNGFSFGLKSDDKKSTNTTPTTSAGFSFGKAATTTASDDKKPAAAPGFSFMAGAAPFSFGNIKPPAASTSTSVGNDEDDEDQPPKVEFKQVVEEDSVYSKKCKVFVKKDGNFADRGVGTLYLKPVKDSDKTQLLVRADTNLGNIIVNLILSAGIPVQRMGKNNVMLVCLPMPNVEKPTSMLLRVKTGEEADELLDTIEKYMK